MWAPSKRSRETMADKLSDKISVIIAPPSTNGDFIGAHLLGGSRNAKPAAEADEEEQVSRADAGKGNSREERQ